MAITPFDPEASLFASNMFTDFTEYRNRARLPAKIVARKLEGVIAFPLIAVVAIVESVARIVLAPLSFLPMLFQTRAERSDHFDKVVQPILWGIPLNFSYSVLAVGAFATNLFVEKVDPTKLNTHLLFWLP